MSIFCTSENPKVVVAGPDILRSNTLTIEEESFTYVWKINNINSHDLKLGQRIDSQSFTSARSTNYQFRMVFYPAGENNERLPPMAALHVHLYPSQTASADSTDDVNAHARVCIPSTMSWCDRDLGGRMIRINPKMQKQNGYVYYADFKRMVRIDDMHNPACGYIIGNVLTITCEVTITQKHNYGTPRRVSEAQNLYYGILLDKQLHYDFRLIVGDRVFPVHRSVLELQSTVFQAMFRNNWIEEENKSVVITDMDPDVMQDFLRFMYTGTVTNISKHADKLLIAADKYDVTALKVACQEEMACSLSADNVVSVLALADLHGAQPLTRHAHDYILNHTVAVHLSPAYQTFIVDFPQIAVRLGLLDEEKKVSPSDDVSNAKGDGPGVNTEQRNKRQRTE